MATKKVFSLGGVASWQALHERKEQGAELNPLEQFIYENEPAVPEDEDIIFRMQLAQAIQFVLEGK